jgi:hypothetical protein
VDRLEIRPGPADADLGRRLDTWLGAYYRRLPRPPRVMPGLYVQVRKRSIGLAELVRSVTGHLW